MKVEPYAGQHKLDPYATINTNHLKGKSVIVTGGASGLGQGFVRMFASHGAFVTFCDVSQPSGEKLASELGSNANFVQCDVTTWEDQLALFKAAIENSPSHGVDIVMPNAGIGVPDSILDIADTDEPVKPALKLLNINLIGVLYTIKLAIHYMSKQSQGEDVDKCIILTDSMAGYVEMPNTVEYGAAKYGVRSIMRTLRHALPQHGIRINSLAPTFIRTAILTPQVHDQLEQLGQVKYGEVEDAVRAAENFACSPQLNGRCAAIVSRSDHEKGYHDMDKDDIGADDWIHPLAQTFLRIGSNQAQGK